MSCQAPVDSVTDVTTDVTPLACLYNHCVWPFEVTYSDEKIRVSIRHHSSQYHQSEKDETRGISFKVVFVELLWSLVHTEESGMTHTKLFTYDRMT